MIHQLIKHRSIVDAADTAFCTLPAPQGRVMPPRSQLNSGVHPSFSYGSFVAPQVPAASSAAPPPAVDMSMFMDRYGGCFAPHSPVKLADGSTIQIENLRPGMLTWGGACVRHVVRMDYNAVVPMVSLPSSAGARSTSQPLRLDAIIHHHQTLPPRS